MSDDLRTRLQQKIEQLKESPTNDTRITWAAELRDLLAAVPEDALKEVMPFVPAENDGTPVTEAPVVIDPAGASPVERYSTWAVGTSDLSPKIDGEYVKAADYDALLITCQQLQDENARLRTDGQG